MRDKKTIWEEHEKAIDQLAPEVGIMHILTADVLDVLIDVRDALNDIAKSGKQIATQLERVGNKLNQ